MLIHLLFGFLIEVNAISLFGPRRKCRLCGIKLDLKYQSFVGFGCWVLVVGWKCKVGKGSMIEVMSLKQQKSDWSGRFK